MKFKNEHFLNLTRLLNKAAVVGMLALSACIHPASSSTTPPALPTPQPFVEAVTVLAPDGTVPAGVTATFSTDAGLGPFTTTTVVDGRLGVTMPASVPRPNGGPLVVSAPGYQTWIGRATTNPNGELCPCYDAAGVPGNAVILHLTAQPWTSAQIRDMQGDLMVWVPQLALSPGPDGIDHRANIAGASSTGQVPGGLFAGWVWSVTIPRYTNLADRELIYQSVLSSGYTHVAIDADACTPGPGYHGLLPTTPADCDTYGARITQVANELHAHHLLLWCADITVGAPFAPGFDGRTLCDLGLDDWDNYNTADCAIDAMAAQFAPTTPLFWEQPSGGSYHPDGDNCSTVVPTDTNGGAWIRSVQQRHPNFVGVFYETDYPDGVAGTIAHLATGHAWWRDAQEVNGESDTYWKFWQGTPPDVARAYNDAVMAGAPQLRGYLSGGSSHQVVVAPTADGHFTGSLSGGDVQTVDGFDFRPFAQTAKITQVTISATGVGVVFDKQDVWPSFTEPSGLGPLQYSLGLAEKINGVWYANAPIELWHGLQESGGPIQQPGQIPTNWFYALRWGALNGYQPQPGETVGVFVVAGDARNSYPSVLERSNIVLLPLPAPGTTGTFVP